MSYTFTIRNDFLMKNLTESLDSKFPVSLNNDDVAISGDHYYTLNEIENIIREGQGISEETEITKVYIDYLEGGSVVDPDGSPEKPFASIADAGGIQDETLYCFCCEHSHAQTPEIIAAPDSGISWVGFCRSDRTYLFPDDGGRFRMTGGFATDEWPELTGQITRIFFFNIDANTTSGAGQDFHFPTCPSFRYYFYSISVVDDLYSVYLGDSNEVLYIAEYCYFGSEFTIDVSMISTFRHSYSDQYLASSKAYFCYINLGSTGFELLGKEVVSVIFDGAVSLTPPSGGSSYGVFQNIVAKAATGDTGKIDGLFVLDTFEFSDDFLFLNVYDVQVRGREFEYEEPAETESVFLELEVWDEKLQLERIHKTDFIDSSNSRSAVWSEALSEITVETYMEQEIFYSEFHKLRKGGVFLLKTDDEIEYESEWERYGSSYGGFVKQNLSYRIPVSERFLGFVGELFDDDGNSKGFLYYADVSTVRVNNYVSEKSYFSAKTLNADSDDALLDGFVENEFRMNYKLVTLTDIDYELDGANLYFLKLTFNEKRLTGPALNEILTLEDW